MNVIPEDLDGAAGPWPLRHLPPLNGVTVSDLIPAGDYVAVFTGIAPDGRTIYHCRPLIAWTVGDEGNLVGRYVNGNGQTAIASDVPNFYRYMSESEWPAFDIAQYRIAKTAGSGAS